MKAKCRKCGDIVEVTRPGEYKSCKCGAIGLDYGDPPYYYRVVGNPENFDGEIEDVPKIKDPIRPSEMCNLGDSMERAMNVIGEENIGGESKSLKDAGLRDPDNPSEAGVAKISMDTANARVVDTNLDNIGTYLEELSIALEETSDLVNKISRLVRERSDKSEEFKNMMKGE